MSLTYPNILALHFANNAKQITSPKAEWKDKEAPVTNNAKILFFAEHLLWWNVRNLLQCVRINFLSLMLHVSKVESYKDDTINFSVMLQVNLHSLQLLQNLMTALLMVTKHIALDMQLT